ncbi:uncharacterized protein DS421_20g687080 [Arachis hypogaea]|nr:uncharacterized protein DS421_20g687080 [Arachis hypogaea]
MVFDAIGVTDMEDVEQEPNLAEKRFYHLLASVAKSLFEGCVPSKFSTCVRMMNIKSNSNHTQESFDKWTTLCNELVSVKTTNISRSHYKAKKLVSKLGLNSVKIDCCLNSCMLYRKGDIDQIACRFCDALRFQVERERIGKRRVKRVSNKWMHYLFLIPRLKQLNASRSSASRTT